MNSVLYLMHCVEIGKAHRLELETCAGVCVCRMLNFQLSLDTKARKCEIEVRKREVSDQLVLAT